MMPRLRLVVLVLLLCAGMTAAAQPAPTPLPLYALPDARTNRAYTSNTLALASDGLTLVAANMLNHSATIFVPTQNRVLAEIPVGHDPRTVALTPDSRRAFVANRRDSTLSIIDMRTAAVVATIPLGGMWAYGVVAGDDNRTAYVSLWGSAEVVIVDTVLGQVTARIPTAAAPAGLLRWGEFLYVSHFWSGLISLIYLPQMRVIETVSTGADVSAFQMIEPDITRGIAYLPQTRSLTLNTALTHDSTLLPAVNVIDLRGLALLRERRIPVDVADRPVNMPFAAALDRFARRLYVANAGSNDVSVIDLDTGTARMNIEVDANPRGILLNRDNTLLFVHSALEGIVTTIDTRTLRVVDKMLISNFTIPVDLLIGAQLFHDSRDPRMSAGGWISCASCHFDGTSDGRVWYGFPGGPRNTPLLFGLAETIPYNWSGNWDELADVEIKIRRLMGGRGLIDDYDMRLFGDEDAANTIHAGLSPDLDALTAYLLALPTPPFRPPTDPAAVERGAAVFREQRCDACHIGAAGTDIRPYAVGSAGSRAERAGDEFNTPSLRWLWLSAPYRHDGAAPTLRAFFELEGEHDLSGRLRPSVIDDLVAYLLAFGG